MPYTLRINNSCNSADSVENVLSWARSSNAAGVSVTLIERSLMEKDLVIVAPILEISLPILALLMLQMIGNFQ